MRNGIAVLVAAIDAVRTKVEDFLEVHVNDTYAKYCWSNTVILLDLAPADLVCFPLTDKWCNPLVRANVF